ncbi:hypothetical protein TREES_T100014901 [Tupaia chinensis]|uniref:Uncharacterized protein n=1 Tax=Tupaia chinensis TaxID=246437 RepID=L9KT38_TUPCH|nr:hypothetical protein TREES_T100014901 [Tupaia chinensis]
MQPRITDAKRPCDEHLAQSIGHLDKDHVWAHTCMSVCSHVSVFERSAVVSMSVTLPAISVDPWALPHTSNLIFILWVDRGGSRVSPNHPASVIPYPMHIVFCIS